MFARQAVNAIVIGAALVVLGLIPGPLARLKHGLQNFRDSLSSWPSNQFSLRAPANARLPGQIWIAVIGMVSIAVGVMVLACD